jgi:signal transduction histidine kinase
MRSSSTILLFTGLVLLLAALGVLQYRWQTEISDSQREKMSKSANENVSRLAEDFNKEIQNAYFNFQVDGGDWQAKNYQPFVERYDFWRGKTNYPGLIADFYFFDAAGDGSPLRFDANGKTFVPVEWTPELRDILTRASDEKNFHPVFDDIFTLVLPEHADSPKIRRVLLRQTTSDQAEAKTRVAAPLEMPKTYGYLAIKLDPSVIRQRLLPDLSAKYFGDGDYRVAVSDRSGTPFYTSTGDVTASDAQAPIFDLAPNDIFFFGNRDLLDTVGERREQFVIDSHVENRTVTRTASPNANENGTVKVEIQRTGPEKTQVFATRMAAPGEHWTVAAQHTDGSIDAFVTGQRNRNLAVGFGMLGLLGLAVAGIIFSAQRARAFAQRQVDFVSSVSHEFRTPLAVIYSAGENLADGVAADPIQTSKYGELIKGEGKKLSAMVEQILSFAGARSAKRKLNIKKTPAAEIVRNALSECGSYIADQQVELEQDIPDTLPAIDVDAGEISKAIQNLIVNSIKYRNGSRWVRVSAANGARAVKISVEDRGIGISKSDLRQVFDPFYRSKTVVDAQIHGNGLGLAIVKQIAEAHGGRVTAESEPGKGSKFTIELPV